MALDQIGIFETHYYSRRRAFSEPRRERRARDLAARYWEHTLRDEGDFERHCDYIHFNPVKHGHVSRATDWPYSSFKKFVEAEVYPTDWAAARTKMARVMENADDGYRMAPRMLRKLRNVGWVEVFCADTHCSAECRERSAVSQVR